MTIEQIQGGIEQLRDLVPGVAKAKEDLDAAIGSRRAAEASLVTTMIEAVKPALRAMATRPRVSQRVFWVNASTEEEVTRAAWAGVLVTGDPDQRAAGPDEDYPRANSGAYEGAEVFLTSDGLIELSYKGHWSRWQGASSQWEATETRLTAAEFVAQYSTPSQSAAEIMLAHLAKALKAQSEGGMVKQTAKAQATAAKFVSMEVLLRGAR